MDEVRGHSGNGREKGTRDEFAKGENEGALEHGSLGCELIVNGSEVGT